VRVPASWDYNDVKVYYGLTPPSFSSRAATRYLGATASPSPTSHAEKKNIRAIAGGVVGGLLGIIALLCLVLFCLHRRKKAKKNQVHDSSSAPPAELAVSEFPHEMPTPDANKYVAAHERTHPSEMSGYTGYALAQPHSPGYGHHSPHASESPHAYESTSPYTDGHHQGSGYGHASHSPLRSPDRAETYFPSDHAAHDAQQSKWDHQPSPSDHSRQGQYPYPTPISPYDTANPTGQQQPQVYYPPPQEPTHGAHRSISEHGGSPANTQYDGDARYGNTPLISTTTTPANFYAQSVPGDIRDSSDDQVGRHGNGTSNHL
jgi:hypothetical protein